MQDLKFVALRTTGHLIGATLLWLMSPRGWTTTTSCLASSPPSGHSAASTAGSTAHGACRGGSLRHIIIRPVTRVVVRTIAEERNR